MTRLVLTPGEGIGPQITAHVLATTPTPQPWTVIGDWAAVEHEARRFGWTLPNWVSVVPVQAAHVGAVCYESLVQAVRRIHQGQADALVTGPISKAHLWQAGYAYTGHTEILQDLATQFWGQPYQSEMLFVHEQFRVLLLTRHVPLAQVGQAMTVPGVTQALSTLVTFLQTRLCLEKPRLLVLGVNPHAGEIGGEEERTVLIPAIETVNARFNLSIPPPVAADGWFRGFNPTCPPVDAVVASYHDQGLIPVKLLAGYAAVNVTLGLPFLRTSVSHGTAPDLLAAASPDSLRAAIQQAQQFCQSPQKTGNSLF
jgi:4-hydroxythreonine-4-phosphate dehydrogenase